MYLIMYRFEDHTPVPVELPVLMFLLPGQNILTDFYCKTASEIKPDMKLAF